MGGTVTIHEYDALVPGHSTGKAEGGTCAVPGAVYEWLEKECLRAGTAGEAAWMRFVQRRGRRAVQVTNYVGVIRAGDFQIEVLPKIGKANQSGNEETRALLVRMLSCLPGFRHIPTESAALRATRMPLLEVFIAEFLETVRVVLKRGMRSTYVVHEGNLPVLRGKLLLSPHLRHNLVRADRCYVEHDEFTTDRPENRLLRAALQSVLPVAATRSNQQMARELLFAMAEVPASTRFVDDFRKVRLDRGMEAYESALAWARLILDQTSPLTAIGAHEAPSLLFPMDAVFEAFVARHLPRQFAFPLTVKAQVKSKHLVRHLAQGWFQLKPDLLVLHEGRNLAVLDTKWKLLDGQKANGTEKYGLSQADFYQLQAYGQSYLGGAGDVFLIFPKTDAFEHPLPVFDFSHAGGLRLWVVPFCLRTRRLAVHETSALGAWRQAG